MTFEIVTERGVYLDSVDAKLDNVRVAGPSERVFDPGTRIKFGITL